MPMKLIPKLLMLLFGLLLLTSYCGDKKGVAGDISSTTNEGEKIDDPTKEEDDGSWVFIIDNTKTTKQEFEDIFNLQLKVAAVASGQGASIVSASADNAKTKRGMAEQLININLASSKAQEDEFFKSEGGKSLKLTFAKQALNQFYMYKEILSKYKEPSQQELDVFYKQNEAGFKQRNITMDSPQGINAVKAAHRNNQTGTKLREEINKLILIKKIIPNNQPLKDYISGKLKRDQVLADTEEKYWILKINAKPMLLKDLVFFLDMQLDQVKSRVDLTKSVYVDKLTEQFSQSFKLMEIGYQAALDKGYSNDPEGQKFVSFVLKRQIANYYLFQNILAKVAEPTAEEMDIVLESPEGKAKVSEYMKANGIKDTSENKKALVKQQLFSEKLMRAKQNFANELKEAHTVRLSDKYFESMSDKVDKELSK